jgi:hypothetical protein
MTASPDAVENLSRRFQIGGSFLMPARFGLKIHPTAGSWQMKKSMSTSCYGFDN